MVEGKTKKATENLLCTMGEDSMTASNMKYLKRKWENMNENHSAVIIANKDGKWLT